VRGRVGLLRTFAELEKFEFRTFDALIMSKGDFLEKKVLRKSHVDIAGGREERSEQR
jgi:hypothetical protein